MPEAVQNKILDFMVNSSATMALQLEGNATKDAQAALALCREAEKLDKGYDPNPFYDGSIAECKAEAERRLNDRKSACAHYAEALKFYGAIPAGHRWAKQGESRLKRTQKSVSEARCG